MKKEATKKSKLWIWLVVGIAALLAVAGVVLALVLGGGAGNGAEGPKGGRADLYWNLDRATYTQNSESGLSTREPGEDGVYRVRYAYNGEVVEIPVADKQLVNYIDTMDCMGLVKDSEGVIIDVVDPKTLATETARMFYVRNASDSVITLNSSMAMNGMTMEIPLAEVTQVYDVATNAEVPGAIVAAKDLQPMDSVTVYSNGLGEATHVYVISHPVESPVYWRADTGMYDSTLKQTKRIPDENGYYTIPFYVDGEYVELKCNIQGIVNTIDNKNRFKAHTGLVLDENGYIVDNMLAATGIRGLLGCEMYDIIEVNGNTFTAENQLSGKMDQYTKTLAADAKIYNVSLEAKPDVRGKAVDSLKVGDRIVTFENTEGEVILVFVAHRLVEGQMYFNVTKKYNSTEKASTRTPNGSGWYTIEMMDEDGVISTFKTKDKAIVDKIDSQNNRSVALELDGDVITYVWEGECVAGYGAFVGYSITNVTGSILSMAPSTNPDNISNRIMTADCKVFNMSGRNKGETTTPQVGDYCIMWRNGKSEINYIYVIRRLVDAPMYFSITRKWDSTTQQTTRERVDGYYVYECICEGKKVTVKTASKEVANFLDSQGPQTFALKVDSNGVIYDYYETVAITGGSKQYLNTIVKRLDVLVLYNPTTQKTYTPKLAEDCKIYNFSTVFTKARGERTTLRMDDNIQCYTNMKGEVAIILVRQRKAEMKMAWNIDPQYDSVEKKTTRTPGADGLYSVQLAVDGKISTYKVSEAAINYLDSANGAVACTMNNGVVVGTQSAIYGPGVWTSTDAAVIATVLEVKGKVLTVKSNKSADPVKITMNSKYVCYDVSGDAEFIGQAVTAKVGDYGRIYLNEAKQAMYFYIQRHGDSTEPIKLYWNVNRQKDDNGSTRTPDADGWYWIDLAVDGEIKTFKTNSKKIIDYIDKGNGGATALTVKGNQIIATASALEGEGVEAAGKSGTVQSINGKTVIHTGVPGGVDMAANCKVYDAVDGSATIGQYTELKVGDNFRCYNNAAGEMLHIYVLSRSGSSTPGAALPAVPALPAAPEYDNSELQLDADNNAECVYCGKTVVWTALEKAAGAALNLEPGKHYYLAENQLENTNYYNVVGGSKEVKGVVCVHLNGHNITSTNRAFAVQRYNQLNIMGNGTVIGGTASQPVINSVGTVNLIGGTYEAAAGAKTVITHGRATEAVSLYKDVVINASSDAAGSAITLTFGDVEIYGATVNGNVSTYGYTGTTKVATNIVLQDGTIDGAVAINDNEGATTLKLSGNAVITEKNGGLTLMENTTSKVTLCELGENAKIYVTGSGALTQASAYAASYVNTKILPATSEIVLKAVDGVIVASGNAQPVWVMAFMAEPAQYDSTNKVTTRTPDADGYYYVKLSVNGEVNTYKTKQRGDDDNGNGIDYADQTGTKRPFAIYLTEEGSLEFLNAKSALFAPDSEDTGATAGVNGTVTAIDGNTITITGGSSNTATLASNVKIFDISASATVIGEAAQLAVGDTYISYVNAENQLTYIYIKARTSAPEPTPEPTWVMAWVVAPDFDEANNCTFRTPDADGYYFVELSVDGVTKTYKTKATGLGGNGNGIDYVDYTGEANRPVAIQLTDKDSVEFTKALAATNNTGAKGAKVAVITGINGNVITADGYEGTLAADAKIFDVSTQAAEIGEFTELRVGDNVRFYTSEADGAGEILYAYVTTRVEVAEIDMNTVFEKANAMASVFANGGEVEAECPACGVNVTWKPMPAISGTTKLTAGHYYFASDMIVSAGYYSVNDGDNNTADKICVHLNGKTFENTGTGNTRSFYVDYNETLTIMGSGNIIGARASTTAAERCGSTLEVVGLGNANICGGTWSKTNNALDVMGCRGRETGTFNIYNGTEINIGDMEGNALWIAGGNVKLMGGVINGDVFVRKYTADTATLKYNIDLTLGDVTINGKIHYSDAMGDKIVTTVKGAPVIAEMATISTLPVQVGRLTKGADIKVTADGVFTTANPNLQDYVDAGFISAKAEGKTVTVTDGVASIVDATAAKVYDNSNLTFTEGNKAMCTFCGEVKEWTALQSTADGSTDGLAAAGHYYLPEDYLENKGRYNISDGNVCVHLNGHNITNISNRVFTVAYKSTAVLNIMGNGIVTGSHNTVTDTTKNVAASTISVRGNLNLIGGTYKSAETSTLPAILMAMATGKINIYEGVTIEGTSEKAGLSLAYGHMVMNGGTITHLDVLGKDVGTTNAQCSATLLGGTVQNAYLDVRDPNGAYKTYQLDMTVEGNVKVNNVELANGAKIIIGRLTKGAEICVTAADGAISVENAKAADYLEYGYFKAAAEGKTITEAGGVLSIG